MAIDGYRWSQNSNGFSISFVGDTGNLYFFPKHFASFSRWRENTYSQFSCKLMQYFVCRLWSVLEVYKQCATTLSPFSRWKMCHMEKRKKHWISTTPTDFIKFSSKWSHYVWPYNSYNRWRWKCRSRSKLTKMLIFDMWIFLEHSQRQISLTIISSHKFERVFEFSIINANNLTVVVLKKCAPFLNFFR